MKKNEETENKTNECNHELKVEIPADEVSKEFEKTLTSFINSAKIKGFRPGRAPKDVVKNMYYSEIKESLINSLAPEVIKKELKKLRVVPVTSPVITDVSFEEGKSLKLTAHYELWPEFKLPEYKKVKIKKKKKSISDKDVNKSLEEMRERSAQYIPVEKRGVADNDYVMIEVKGKDTKTKKLLPTEKTFVLAGHPDNEKSLNENLIGMKEKEVKQFVVNCKKNNPNKKIAGKEIEYSLLVISVKEKKLPKINDEFAKEIGKFESLKDLKAEIRKVMSNDKENSAKRETSDEIIQQIVGKVDFDLPESIVQQETLANLRRIQESRPNQKFSKEEIKKIQEDAKKNAERNIKNHLILKKIAEIENLEVSEAEITEELKEIAKANNVSLPKVVESVNKSGKKQELKQNLVLKKTVDFLVENAIIE
jgi:trigger factor